VITAALATYLAFPTFTLNLVLAVERWNAGFASHHTLTADGVVPYLEAGTGPTVLLLHGFEDSKENWIPFGRHLIRTYHVVIPDMAGHGDNHDTTNGDYRPAAQARRMADFLNAIGIRAAHIVGVSMGGEIAGAFAADYPARTLSVAMISASGTRPDAPTPLGRRILAGDDIFHVASRRDLDTLIALIGDSGLTLPAELKRAMLAEYRRRNPQWDTIFAQLTEPAQLYLLDSLAPRITAPALVLWGARDPLFAVSGARRLANALPRALFVVLPDCGHLCPVTQAAETSAAYATFLSAFVSGSSPARPAR
jgi:pimeloyl-ACP methyl ester carboxylesterase